MKKKPQKKKNVSRITERSSSIFYSQLFIQLITVYFRVLRVCNSLIDKFVPFYAIASPAKNNLTRNNSNRTPANPKAKRIAARRLIEIQSPHQANGVFGRRI